MKRPLFVALVESASLGPPFTAVTASARTTADTAHRRTRVPWACHRITSVESDRTVRVTGSVISCQPCPTFGARGSRFPKDAMVCPDRSIPPAGDDVHVDDGVVIGEDPTTYREETRSFVETLAGHDLLWSGRLNGGQRSGVARFKSP